MVRVLLLLVSLILLRSSASSGQINQRPGDFDLLGHVKGRDTGIIVLGYLNREGKSILDTAKLNDGYFSFKGTVSQPTIAHLIGNVKSRVMDDPGRRMIFIEAGIMTAELTEGQFKTARIIGSGTQLELDTLERKLNNYWESVDRARLRGDSDEANLYRSKVETAKYDFIRSKPNSFVSPFLLTGIQNVPLDSLKKSYASFSEPVKQGYFGRAIERNIFNIQGAATDKQAYEFVKKDWKGKEISLVQFKNKKYVLLDFWASWCIPCHKQVPHLNRLYELYHAKGLEIIGVSADSNDELWNNAILKAGIGHWRHISSGRSRNVKDGENLEQKFAVGAYPTLILIDKEGKIIFRVEGYDEVKLKELEDLLASLPISGLH